MLVRAARRTARPDLIRKKAVGEQLSFPWLFSASNASRRELRRITVDGSAPGLESRRRRNSNDGSKISSRTLATAATTSGYGDLPLMGFSEQYPVSSNGHATSLATLRPVSSPLVLAGLMDQPETRLRVDHTTQIGGTFPELLAIFRACLQVGSIERAKAVLKRMERFSEITQEDFVELHNEWLEGAVSQMLWRPSGAANQAVHKFFELELREPNYPINAETIGWMLKASLQSLDQGRKIRLVERYMEAARERDLGLEVLGLDILSAADLNQITQICPEYNTGYERESGYERDEEYLEEETAEIPPEAQKPYVPPQLRSVPQKGLGLRSLKQTLSLFYENEAAGMSIGNTEEERREAQRRLETSAVDSAIDRWREENTQLKKLGLDTTLQTKSMGARMWKWSKDLEEALDLEMEKIAEAELREPKQDADYDRCQYGPFLRQLPTSKLAAITILSVMGYSGIGAARSIPLQGVMLAIANNLEEETLINYVQVKNKKTAWGAAVKSAEKNRIISAQIKRAKRSQGSPSIVKSDADGSEQGQTRFYPDSAVREALAEVSWPIVIKTRIGAYLLTALMEVAKIPVTLEHAETKEMVTQMQPALQHSYTFNQGKKVGVILLNTTLVRQMNREPVHSLLAKHLPMLVTPEPWTDIKTGGFLCGGSKVMRMKAGDKDQKHYMEAAISQGDMQQVFRGLDVLGKTP